jgi:hypothetical protein
MNYEQGSLVVWYWQGETEVLGEKPLSHTYWPAQDRDLPVRVGFVAELQAKFLYTEFYS